MEAAPVLLAANLASTFYMVGLIWFVQLVHYPLLARVGESEFASFERAHVARTGPVVGPPMLVELATALLLVVSPPAQVPSAALWLGLALLGVVWASTGLLQVPSHRRLEMGFDARAHHRLVATNWIRTVAWTARGILLLWLFLVMAAGGQA